MIQLDYTYPSLPKSLSSIPSPPGYVPPSSARELASTKSKQSDPQALALQTRQSTELKLRRAWDVAFAPAKSLPMQAIMLYMSGSSVQIFSLGMIFTLVTSPLSAVFNIFKSRSSSALPLLPSTHCSVSPAFEALRPTPPVGKDGKAAEPSYAGLFVPMTAYLACQGLVVPVWGYYRRRRRTGFSSRRGPRQVSLLPEGTIERLIVKSTQAPEWSSVRTSSLG
ncbi:ER membrane protein complex subunit 4, partial [Tremellales sp. Uapishka_1]